MASLKTLITLTTLKKIPHNVLEEKLACIKSELENLNIWTDKGIKYQSLTHYLQENCPSDLEDFICSFSLIAKPELYERIVEKLNLFGIETSPSDDVETIAAKLADRDIHSCNIIAARKMASESHSYSHYIPYVPHTARQLTNEEIEKLKTDTLSPYFEKTGKSKYIDIYPHITDEFAFYCISHGSPKTREHSVGEPEEEKVHTFRPELVDIVRINLRNAEISVFTKKTSSEHLRNFYVGAFGRIILPDSHFVPNNKFDLDKLRDKRTFIVGEFLGQIVSVEPFSFSYLTHSGCKREVSKSITEEFDEVIKNNWKIISMKFNVVFSDAPNKKCKISILSQNRSEFPVGANESIIENYFTSRGVIRDIYREETFKLVSGTSALSA